MKENKLHPVRQMKLALREYSQLETHISQILRISRTYNLDLCNAYNDLQNQKESHILDIKAAAKQIIEVL